MWCNKRRGLVIGNLLSYAGAPASSLIPEIGCHKFYVFLLSTYKEILVQKFQISNDRFVPTISNAPFAIMFPLDEM
jgi:hypothetical protein